MSDEELVFRVIAGEAAVKAMLAAGAPKEYLSATQPLIKLIGELAKRKDCSQVYIRKGELVLCLEKRQLAGLTLEHLHFWDGPQFILIRSEKYRPAAARIRFCLEASGQ